MLDVANIRGIVKGVHEDIWRALRHPMARDAGTLAFSQYIAAVVSLGTTVVAARLLGPTDYGIAVLIMSYPTLLWSFISLKPVTVTTRYISSFRATEKREELISTCKLGYSLDLAASLAVILLIGFTGWLIAAYVYNMPQVEWLMVFYSVSFPFFSFTGTSSAILTSWKKFRWLAILQILERTVTFTLVVILLLSGLGIPGLVFGRALGQAISGLVMGSAATLFLYQEGLGFWWKGPIANIRPLWREIIAFFGWNYLIVTLSGFVAQVPLILLGRFRGPEEAGFYRLGTSLVTTISYPETSMRRVVYPTLSARWGLGEQAGFGATFRRWTLRPGVGIGALVILVIFLFPILIPMLFGPAFGSMVLGAQVMLSGAIAGAVFFWLTPFYYAAGRIGEWAKAYLIYSACVIGFAWIVIPQWGFLGIAGVVGLGKVMFTLFLVLSCRATLGKAQ